MESFETGYSPELTYEEILAFPAKLIDRWAFDQTFIRTGGCVAETLKILQIPHAYISDLQSLPSEDLLAYLWLDRFEGEFSKSQPFELPMPDAKYLAFASTGCLATC